MIRRVLLATALCTAVAAAWAQPRGWPAKPIRFIVPFAPGGVSDNVARIVAKELQARLGQPVLVENKPGAATNIANGEVARATPDGYTLLMVTNLVVSNPLLYKSVPYKVEQLAPVAPLFTVPLVLTASKDLPVATLKDFVAYAKARPGELNYGTAGTGSTPHMFGEQFNKLAGTDIRHIPFKGSAPILQEMIAGRVHMSIDGLPPSLVQHKAGNIKILGVLSKDRIAQLPDVPTLTESGIPIVSASWWGVMAPAATPKDVVQLLNTTIRRIAASPEYREQMVLANATVAEDQTPEQFAAFMARDQEVWRKVIEPLGLQLD